MAYVGDVEHVVLGVELHVHLASHRSTIVLRAGSLGHYEQDVSEVFSKFFVHLLRNKVTNILDE